MKFNIAPMRNGKFAIKFGDRTIRKDLSKEHAKALRDEFDKLRLVKLTRSSCAYCHGIGGCFYCDS